MLRVGGKVLALPALLPMPCNSVLLIACIPCRRTSDKQCFNLCLSRAGNVTDLLFIALIQQDLELAPERIVIAKRW